ncbi:hypothetical protein G6O67_002081 [Ophiocordyceps sinensis]|uniref:Uncharacterized protein n=1 Tax=Ophiocordyceps sinensis TaxID=72228 RepID=A0A8H4V6X2_9HYPO|nr:hypothetical protein G6O67_002081 [Ophiocordyceps sinensis]
MAPHEYHYADSSDEESEKFDHSFEKRQIAWQFGCIVSLIQPNLVLKQGAKVRPAEMRAMRLVQEHTPDIPIPRIRASEFRFEKNGIPCTLPAYIAPPTALLLATLY